MPGSNNTSPFRRSRIPRLTPPTPSKSRPRGPRPNVYNTNLNVPAGPLPRRPLPQVPPRPTRAAGRRATPASSNDNEVQRLQMKVAGLKVRFDQLALQAKEAERPAESAEQRATQATDIHRDLEKEREKNHQLIEERDKLRIDVKHAQIIGAKATEHRLASHQWRSAYHQCMETLAELQARLREKEDEVRALREQIPTHNALEFAYGQDLLSNFEREKLKVLEQANVNHQLTLAEAADQVRGRDKHIASLKKAIEEQKSKLFEQDEKMEEDKLELDRLTNENINLHADIMINRSLSSTHRPRSRSDSLLPSDEAVPLARRHQPSDLCGGLQMIEATPVYSPPGPARHTPSIADHPRAEYLRIAERERLRISPVQAVEVSPVSPSVYSDATPRPRSSSSSSHSLRRFVTEPGIRMVPFSPSDHFEPAPESQAHPLARPGLSAPVVINLTVNTLEKKTFPFLRRFHNAVFSKPGFDFDGPPEIMDRIFNEVDEQAERERVTVLQQRDLVKNFDKASKDNQRLEAQVRKLQKENSDLKLRNKEMRKDVERLSKQVRETERERRVFTPAPMARRPLAPTPAPVARPPRVPDGARTRDGRYGRHDGDDEDEYRPTYRY
ncbi:hypothetical protein CC80DRAFT_594111 [Byssothecium circinans]|uniref:Uncharacterized protein n=1 Tax=Byssothecium circinans TaxID=147558 RepID=A0A6A5TTG9_9PLEO|nr:hypothetical protein CC80DRAFT_594111 [Byssothecium circinans]